MKKLSILIFSLLFLQLGSAAHASDTLKAYFFYGNGCPHCAKELEFLEKMGEKYPDFEVEGFEIYNNKENLLLLQKLGKAMDADTGGVPFLVIGDKYFIGYADEITSGEIESKVKECMEGGCRDQVAAIMGSGNENPGMIIDDPGQNIGTQDNQGSKKNLEKNINLPIIGSVEISSMSLPVLTVAMGFLDGFNPCAMWALLFLISLLLGMKDRRRMWILGVAFIVASAAVYFVFMAAWLNLILFLGFVVWVRLLIGGLALFGGGYNLKEFIFNRNSGCKVAGNEKRQQVFQRLKMLTEKNEFWIAFAGIIALAFMVNLVELICSAGLPAVYTQVLALNEITVWKYYLYIFSYIIFFMLDDLIVFFVAMITLEMTGITTKYSKYSQLIGGVLMLAIGILLIFKHEWLMFG